MDFSFEDLRKKKVVELREIARDIDHEAVKGATQMNKEHLLEAICKALNIDMHVHHVAHLKGKTKMRATIRNLKIRRNKAMEEKNTAEYRTCIREIHNLKRALRKAAD